MECSNNFAKLPPVIHDISLRGKSAKQFVRDGCLAPPPPIIIANLGYYGEGGKEAVAHGAFEVWDHYHKAEIARILEGEINRK